MTESAGSSASEQLTKQYSAEAKAYRDYWSPVLIPMSRSLVDWLPNVDARRILDLGAGVGTLLPVLQEKHPHAIVVGVDKAEGMLTLAEVEWPLAVMDATQLGVREKVFDVALMAFILFHLPDPLIGLIEARNVLRPGGILALTTWGEDIDAPAVHVWNEELESHGAVTCESLQRLAQHDLMDSPEKVTGLLESAGFTDVRTDEREFVHEMQLEDFIRLRTSIGGNKQRFESLDDITQKRCLEKARARLSKESTPRVHLQMKAILASARSPLG